jgi:plasmid stability protein
MAVVTIRKLRQEIHRALKLRAARHGRSTEAEIRDILEQTVRPETHPRIGSELAAFGRRFRGLDLDLTRDRTPADPAKFE